MLMERKHLRPKETLYRKVIMFQTSTTILNLGLDGLR